MSKARASLNGSDAPPGDGTSPVLSALAACFSTSPSAWR
jgi:hypothetical protein